MDNEEFEQPQSIGQVTKCEGMKPAIPHEGLVVVFSMHSMCDGS